MIKDVVNPLTIRELANSPWPGPEITKEPSQLWPSDPNGPKRTKCSCLRDCICSNCNPTRTDRRDPWSNGRRKSSGVIAPPFRRALKIRRKG